MTFAVPGTRSDPRLPELHEMSRGILDHDDSHVRRRDGQRLAAACDDGCAEGPHPRERRVHVAHEDLHHDGAGILDAPLDGPSIAPRNLDDLDAALERRRSRDLPAQTRVGQAEHRAELRIRVRVRRLAVHLEADGAIKRHGRVEVGDDRAEEVPRTEDEARRRGRRGAQRPGLRLREARSERRNDNEPPEPR